jgi:hypothetical protein
MSKINLVNELSYNQVQHTDLAGWKWHMTTWQQIVALT